VDDARGKLADVAQLEGLQMAQIARSGIKGCSCGGRVSGSDVATDDGRPPRIKPRCKALVD
jgi:hypothetical protein